MGAHTKSNLLEQALHGTQRSQVLSKLTGPGSIYQVQRKENLAPDKLFFFLKIDHLDLGIYPRTQQGIWTHGGFIGNKFDFSELTGIGQSTMFTGKKNWLRTNFFFSSKLTT